MEAEAHVNEEQQTGFNDPYSLPSYWLTRFMILRLLGLIYAVAFLVAMRDDCTISNQHYA